MSRSSISGESVAGPKVAMILVFLKPLMLMGLLL
jgi:hypothetical protein